MKETGLNMRQLYLRKKLNFILLIFNNVKLTHLDRGSKAS